MILMAAGTSMGVFLQTPRFASVERVAGVYLMSHIYSDSPVALGSFSSLSLGGVYSPVSYGGVASLGASTSKLAQLLEEQSIAAVPGAFGLSFTYLGYGTAYSFSETGEATGSFSPYSMAVSLGYALSLEKFVNLPLDAGVSLGYILEGLYPGQSYSGFSMDIDAVYFLENLKGITTKMAVGVDDIGLSFAGNGTYVVPTFVFLSAAASKSISSLEVAGGFQGGYFVGDKSLDVRAALEVGYTIPSVGAIYASGGYRLYGSMISAGIGFYADSLSEKIGFNPYVDLSFTYSSVLYTALVSISGSL